MQIHDMVNMWHKSRLDAGIWIITFLTVVIIDIDYGLVVGVAASLVLLLIKNQKPNFARLGNIPNTDLYLDLFSYEKVRKMFLSNLLIIIF